MLAWIFQTGEPLHCDIEKLRPMRAMNLANSLIERGHKVVIWSSAFYHQKKLHRCKKFESIIINEQLTVNLIPSPGYEKNIGLSRLYDHFVLSRNLSKLLKSESFAKPDVGFVGYPPIEFAAVATNWLKKHDVSVVVDVKDQWPTIFVEALPRKLKPIGRLLFAPYFYLARRALGRALFLTGISQHYLEWAASIAGRRIRSDDKIFSLTSPRVTFSNYDIHLAKDWWRRHGLSLTSKNCLCFVGSLSQAFDFTGIRDAAIRLNEEGVDCKFVICGDGGAANDIKTMMSGLDNVIFPGWIDQPKIAVLAQLSIGALAPYKNTPDFMQSIPNKIIDSLAFGLPILTSLKGEVQSLVQGYGVGFVCRDGEGSSWYNCIKSLLYKDGLAEDMSQKASALFDDFFSFEKVYGGMVNVFEEIAANDG